MKYLLDTNAVIALTQKHAPLIKRLREHRPDDFALSAIVYFELVYGAYNSMKIEENLHVLAQLPFEILPFSQEDADQAGQIRAILKRKGTPIGAYDLLIAGQAINRALILITHNTQEFERVSGLRWEDWLA